MGDAFKGLTIRIGADVRPLNTAVNKVRSAASSAQREMNRLKKAAQMDPGNMRVMQQQVSAVEDRLRLAARESNMLKNGLSQARAQARNLMGVAGSTTGKLEGMERATRGIYAAQERANSEYNIANAKLQSVYDSIAHVKAAQDKIGFTKAQKQVKNLVRDLEKGGAAATEASNKLRSLMSSGSFAAPLGITGSSNLDVANKTLSTIKSLRTAQKAANDEMQRMNALASYKNLEIQAAAAEAQMRGLAMEAARTVSEFYKMGGANSEIAKAIGKVNALDSALDEAQAGAKMMEETYKRVPHSISAARDMMHAMALEQDTVRQKLKATEAVLDEIENDPAFDKQRASTRNVYSDVEKLTHALAEAKTQSAMAEDRIASLNAELKEASDARFIGPKRDLEVIQREASRAAGELTNLANKEDRLDAELHAANLDKDWVEYGNSAKRYGAILDEIETKHKGIGRQGFANLGASIKNMGYAAYSTLTPAIMMGGRYAIQSAEEIDAAYRNVRKTVQGTEEEYVKFKDAALDFSRTHVTSADKFLEIGAIGGQLGIGIDRLQAFSETVSNLDVAVDSMDAEEIAADLGKMGSVMGLTVDEYDKFGDALVRLGNNEPAFESDIMTIATRFMGMGKVVGMSSHEMLGWATAATATGQKAEAAGSSMLRFVSNVNKAVSEGGKNLDIIAKTAGMSVDEFSSKFKEDASGALYSFIEGMGEIKKSGGDASQVLADLGMNNVRDRQLLLGLTNQMANATEQNNILKDSLLMSKDAWEGITDQWGAAGDAEREAARKSEGFSGQLSILRNNAQMLGSELAEGAVPFIRSLNELFGNLTGTIKSLSPGWKQFIVGAAGVTAAFGPTAVAIGSVMTGISNIKQTMAKFPVGMMFAKMLGGGTSGMADNVIQFNNAAKGAAGNVEKVGKSAGKMGGAMKAASGATGAFASALGGLAIAAGVAIAAFAISKLVEWRTHVEAVENATHGLASAQDDAFAKMKGYAESASASYQDIGEEVKKLAEEQSATANEFKEQWSDLYVDKAKVDGYIATIEELANQENLTSIEQERLKAAVKGYNAMTGDSISLIDAATGKLQNENGEILASTDALKKNTDEWFNNAKAKLYEEQAEAAVKNRVKTQEALNAAQQKYNDLVAKGPDRTQGAAGVTAWEGEKAKAETRIRELQNLLNGADVSEALNTAKLAASSDGLMKYVENVEGLEEALSQASISTDTLAGYLELMGMSLDDVKNISDESWDEMKRAFAGGSESAARHMAKMAGVTGSNFDSMWASCNGDVNLMMSKIVEYNKLKAEDKKPIVDAKGNVIDGSAHLKVGSMKSMLESLQGSHAASINLSVIGMEMLDKASSKVGELLRKMAGSKKAATGAFVSGSMHPVPAHAAGGMTGIVTAPTLTNWGIIGEAGAEALVRWARGTAVVPIENSRYMTPFAQEIASQIGGAGDTVVYNITIDGMTFNDDPAMMRVCQQFVERARINGYASARR